MSRPVEDTMAESTRDIVIATSAHAAAFRTLLLFTPEAARQIPYVLTGS
jgi:hypothetical protein